MLRPIPQEVHLRPISFFDVSKEEIVDAIAKAEGPIQSFIAVNAHTVYLAERDVQFQKVLGESFLFCDGFGVHLLCLLQGLGRPRNRNTPTDFMWDVFARLAADKKTVFLLGDEPGVSEKFAELLEQKHPSIVAGYHHGFFKPGEEETEILAKIDGAAPHLLCTGMGQPRQEKWVYDRMSVLKCPAAFHIGASMAFAIGARKRGPHWATDHGLEWLFRVLSEPKRMFSRYFVEIPWLIWRAIAHWKEKN